MREPTTHTGYPIARFAPDDASEVHNAAVGGEVKSTYPSLPPNQGRKKGQL